MDKNDRSTDSCKIEEMDTFCPCCRRCVLKVKEKMIFSDPTVINRDTNPYVTYQNVPERSEYQSVRRIDPASCVQLTFLAVRMIVLDGSG